MTMGISRFFAFEVSVSVQCLMAFYVKVKNNSDRIFIIGALSGFETRYSIYIQCVKDTCCLKLNKIKDVVDLGNIS